jgi:hypothetical protein
LNVTAAIFRAVPILAQYSDDDSGIVRIGLLRAGLSPEQTTEAVAFIPLAFGRELLTGMGVTLSDSYVQAGDGGSRVERKLADEPVFSEALKLAPRIAAEMGQGVFTAVALQSSELKAVNETLNQGADPASLVASSPVVLLPHAPAHDKRPWWKFW